MKKVILLGLILISTISIYFTYSEVEDRNKNITLNESEIEVEDLELDIFEEKMLQKVEEHLSLSKIDKVLEEEKSHITLKDIEPEIVRDSIDIITPLSLDEVKNLPLKEGITPLTAIQLTKNTIKKLKVGDRISLPQLGDGQFDANITSKIVHKNGAISVSGNLLDTYGHYSVVLTEGKNMIFGTINTPSGSFEIEVKDGSGYIYATQTIDENWIEYEKDDFLIPNHQSN